MFYFNFSRRLIVEDSNRSHQRGLEHLKEAKEFAEWSKKDREARLPPLTEEQRAQMREYLKIVQKHGLNMSFTDGKERLGCPVMQVRKKEAAAAAAAAAAESS